MIIYCFNQATLLVVPPPSKKSAPVLCQGAAEPAKQRVKRRVSQLFGQSQRITLLLTLSYYIVSPLNHHTCNLNPAKSPFWLHVSPENKNYQRTFANLRRVLRFAVALQGDVAAGGGHGAPSAAPVLGRGFVQIGM